MPYSSNGNESIYMTNYLVIDFTIVRLRFQIKKMCERCFVYLCVFPITATSTCFTNVS